MSLSSASGQIYTPDNEDAELLDIFNLILKQMEDYFTIVWKHCDVIWSSKTGVSLECYQDL